MTENTPIAIALAVAMVAFLTWLLKPSGFRRLRWTSFAMAAGLFWGALAAILFILLWSSYYAYFAPPWQRIAGPFAAAALYSLVVLLLRWLALRLPGNPTITFCLLGGLESLPEHTIAISRFRILEIPTLQGSSPASILFFAFFEYVVYWGVVLAMASLVSRLFRRRPGRLAPNPPPQEPLPPNIYESAAPVKKGRSESTASS